MILLVRSTLRVACIDHGKNVFQRDVCQDGDARLEDVAAAAHGLLPPVNFRGDSLRCVAGQQVLGRQSARLNRPRIVRFPNSKSLRNRPISQPRRPPRTKSHPRILLRKQISLQSRDSSFKIGDFSWDFLVPASWQLIHCGSRDVETTSV